MGIPSPLAIVVCLVVLGGYRLIGRASVPLYLGTALILAFMTYQRNADYGSAVQLWRDTVSKKPNNARARNQYGYALFISGHPEEARQQFDAALKLEPDSPDSHYNIATVFLHFGQNAEAISEYRKTLDSVSDYPGAETNYGLALVQSGRPSEAIYHYRKALEEDAQVRTAHNDLGVALAQTGRLAEALSEFKTASAMDPDYAEAHNNLRKRRNANSETSDLAIREFTRAVRLNPDYAEAHNNLAIALEQSGRIGEAVGQYKEVIRLAPNFTEARKKLAQLTIRDS